MFTVEKNTARMTGTVTFIVTEDNNGCKVEGTDYYFDHEDAQAEADKRNGVCENCGGPEGYPSGHAVGCYNRPVKDAKYAPETLLSMLDDVANGVDDHGGISVRDIVHDIIEDIKASYKLAMVNLETMTTAQMGEVEATVNDYIANHYGDN